MLMSEMWSVRNREELRLCLSFGVRGVFQAGEHMTAGIEGHCKDLHSGIGAHRQGPTLGDQARHRPHQPTSACPTLPHPLQLSLGTHRTPPSQYFPTNSHSCPYWLLEQGGSLLTQFLLRDQSPAPYPNSLPLVSPA